MEECVLMLRLKRDVENDQKIQSTISRTEMPERAHTKKTVVVKDASLGMMVSNPTVVACLFETAATAK